MPPANTWQALRGQITVSLLLWYLGAEARRTPMMASFSPMPGSCLSVCTGGVWSFQCRHCASFCLCHKTPEKNEPQGEMVSSRSQFWEFLLFSIVWFQDTAESSPTDFLPRFRSVASAQGKGLRTSNLRYNRINSHTRCLKHALYSPARYKLPNIYTYYIRSLTACWE